jgi:hypothetical protein
MHKSPLLISIITIFFFINFIGCIEEDNNSNQDIISWEVLDCDKKSTHFLFNWTDEITGENYSKVTSGISNVSLKIKNTGNQDFILKIDFEFILSEILKNVDTEIIKITSEKCLCDSLEHSNNSFYSSKVINLSPGEIETVYQLFDKEYKYGFKAIKWCYEINLE